MLNDNDMIDNRSLFFLIIAIIIEMGLLTAPRTFSEAVGNDAWLSVIFSYIPILLSCFFIVRLSQLFPGESLFSYGPKIIGSWMGNILTLIFVFYWILNGARIVRIFADLLKSTLLFRTPIELIILIFLILAAYLARGGIEPIARFSTIAVLVSVPIGILLVLATYSDWDFSNILPILGHGILPVAFSGIKFLGSLEGLESLLFLLAFVREPKKSLPYCLSGIFFIQTIVLLMTLAALFDFGVSETSRLVFPGISLIQSVEIPGRFLERLGSIYVAIWILILYPTVVVFMLLPSLSLAKLFRLSEPRSFVLFLIPPVYALSLIPANQGQVFQFVKLMTPINIAIIGVVPLGLYIIARLRGFKPERKRR